MTRAKGAAASKKRGAARASASPVAITVAAVANAERGEHAIMLAGRKYALRPSHAAQVAIEAETGRTYMQLARDGQTGSLRLEHAAIVATHMINAEAGDNLVKQVSVERISEMIYEEGVPGIAPVLAMAMVDALTGGRTATGEAKAAAA